MEGEREKLVDDFAAWAAHRRGVDRFLSWCEERGAEPADSRPQYAAELAPLHDDSLLSWPPARNQRCWCGSGRKYKKCCGAPGSGIA
jgi:uncharacterized protein YecA (UPF0149 family)